MMEDPTAADFGSVDASEPRRWRYRLPISISLIGIFIVLGFHLALRMQIRPPSLWIYWIGLVLVAVPGVLAGERKAATFSLGAFAFLQCFAYSLSSPFGLVYLRDPLYNMQLATLVQTTQTWHPAMGAGQAFAYSFYPGSNLFHVAVAFATGLPVETLYLFATGIRRLAVLPLGLARMLGRFGKPQATYIAVAIFLATPSNLFDLPHQQEFAYAFLILGLYAALLSTTAQRGFRIGAVRGLGWLLVHQGRARRHRGGSADSPHHRAPRGVHFAAANESIVRPRAARRRGPARLVPRRLGPAARIHPALGHRRIVHPASDLRVLPHRLCAPRRTRLRVRPP